MYEGLSHAEVIKYYGLSFKTLDAAQAQMDFYEEILNAGTGIWWAICYKDCPNELIGTCGFNDWNPFFKRAEIGYWLLTEQWRNGVMKECIPVIIKYAFDEIHIHRITALVEEGNKASALQLKYFGFQYEGTHKKNVK